MKFAVAFSVLLAPVVVLPAIIWGEDAFWRAFSIAIMLLVVTTSAVGIANYLQRDRAFSD